MKSKKINRDPVRSLKELAVMFGVSSHSLATQIQQDPEAPKPAIPKGSRLNSHKIPNPSKSRENHYRLAEMKAWWAKKHGNEDK